MGTRALVHVKESGKDSQTLVTIYRQYDGYPEGLGEQLRDFIGNTKLSNGIQPNCFNGMGCFAGSLIGHLKDRIGNVYIIPVDSEGVNEEYTYTIYSDNPDIEFNETANIIIKCEQIL